MKYCRMSAGQNGIRRKQNIFRTSKWFSQDIKLVVMNEKDIRLKTMLPNDTVTETDTHISAQTHTYTI